VRAPSLAATPYMGWNTYYGVGGVFDEQTIMSIAEALIDRGLARAGYRIVWLDFGWAPGARDADGELTIDSGQWPHGLRWLTDQLHARGLLAGIYTDAGPSGCDGRGVGSLGHYKQDADRFGRWGFDAVKIDFCGGGQERLDPEACCREFARALRGNSSRRPLIINVCNFWRPGQVGDGYPPPERSAYATHRWASQISQSWRTDTDIGFTGDVVFANVLRNLDANARHPESAGPGRWNDPDHIVPELGLSGAESRAQFTMWAIVAAPLVIGADVRTLSDHAASMLSNPEVLAIDQDPLGVQGTRIKRDQDGEVWLKPLAGEDRAIALLNRGPTPLRVTVDAAEIGLPPDGAFHARDLWNHTATDAAGSIAAELPAHAAALYRISPGAAHATDDALRAQPRRIAVGRPDLSQVGKLRHTDPWRNR
jgi:alpha-galactosidase